MRSIINGAILGVILVTGSGGLWSNLQKHRRRVGLGSKSKVTVLWPGS